MRIDDKGHRAQDLRFPSLLESVILQGIAPKGPTGLQHKVQVGMEQLETLGLRSVQAAVVATAGN